jgi:1-acyl-sn-glycerol-3-phosphate acyltransferase
MLMKLAGKLVLALTGYRYTVASDVLSDPKQVLVGFPHTSLIDGVVAMAVFAAHGLPFHILVKQELFVPPLSWLLNALGCIAVDRKANNNVVAMMAQQFNSQAKFALALAPEATRSHNGETRPIKMGFWHIAKAANVPIVLMSLDKTSKQGRIFAKVQPSHDMAADLLHIQALYAPLGITVLLPVTKD